MRRDDDFGIHAERRRQREHAGQVEDDRPSQQRRRSSDRRRSLVRSTNVVPCLEKRICSTRVSSSSADVSPYSSTRRSADAFAIRSAPGLSAFTTRMPPGGTACASSLLALTISSVEPKRSRCMSPTAVINPAEGGVSSHSRRIEPRLEGAHLDDHEPVTEDQLLTNVARDPHQRVDAARWRRGSARRTAGCGRASPSSCSSRSCR